MSKIDEYFYDDLLDTFIEVDILNPENFCKIKETLTRIGIASARSNTLFQSCHILYKQQKYYIVHFLEMFLLDGKDSNFNADDLSRRNTIASLLEQWGLLKIIHKDTVDMSVKAPMSCIKVLPYIKKKDWNLVAKYTIGNDYNSV